MESSKKYDNATPESSLNISVGDRTTGWLQKRPKSSQNFSVKSTNGKNNIRASSKPRSPLKKKAFFKEKFTYAMTSTIATKELSPISIHQRTIAKKLNIHIKHPIKIKNKLHKNTELTHKLFED